MYEKKLILQFCIKELMAQSNIVIVRVDHTKLLNCVTVYLTGMQSYFCIVDTFNSYHHYQIYW